MKYTCETCGEVFDSADECLAHEVDMHRPFPKAEEFVWTLSLTLSVSRERMVQMHRTGNTADTPGVSLMTVITVSDGSWQICCRETDRVRALGLLAEHAREVLNRRIDSLRRSLDSALAAVYCAQKSLVNVEIGR